MKTFKKISFLLALSIIFTGCDALSDLITIKLKNQKMTKDVQISVGAPQSANGQGIVAASTPFTKTAKLQISDSEELSDYLENIKDIILDSVTCKVYGVSQGDVQSLKVTINPLNYVKTINPVLVDQEINVPFTDDEFKAIANTLLESKEVEFVLDGVVSKTPLTFHIAVTVDADFVVKVLK